MSVTTTIDYRRLAVELARPVSIVYVLLGLDGDVVKEEVDPVSLQRIIAVSPLAHRRIRDEMWLATGKRMEDVVATRHINGLSVTHPLGYAGSAGKVVL